MDLLNLEAMTMSENRSVMPWVGRLAAAGLIGFAAYTAFSAWETEAQARLRADACFAAQTSILRANPASAVQFCSSVPGINLDQALKAGLLLAGAIGLLVTSAALAQAAEATREAAAARQAIEAMRWAANATARDAR